jgi:hypothetical protein
MVAEKIRRWLRDILTRSSRTPGPMEPGRWSTQKNRPSYTAEELEGMIKAGSLTVEGGEGHSREDAIILRKVPGMLAGREIAVILAERILDQPSAEWQSKKIEYVPNMECSPPCFHYGILVTLNDGSPREVWFQIYHLPIITGNSNNT